MRLENKTVLVTGAGKGIGRAIAIGMALEGANVIVNYHTGKAGALETAEEIKGLGRDAFTFCCDVSNVDQIKEMFAMVKKDCGKLDVLVNNAGVTGWGDLFSYTEEQWDQVMGINAKGSFFCSIEAAKMMRETRSGAIINISTNCAALGVKNLAVYAASKGAIHAMTKQLACELAQYNIRVNTFAPGPTTVERNLRDDKNYDQTWGQVVPLGRAAKPEEMVGAAVFLASGESMFMTGQVFFVDGGWSVQGMTPGDYWDRALAKQ